MISRSPQRYTFQLEIYLKNCEERNETPNSTYVGNLQKIIEDHHNNSFTTKESRTNNLEYDLLTTDWILEKVRSNDIYAQNLYAAMCNNDFIRAEMWALLKNQTWSCSWRHAGGIIADMRQQGDYIDWYCSGIRESYDDGRVPEMVVTDEIEQDLYKLGWIVVEYPKDQ